MYLFDYGKNLVEESGLLMGVLVKLLTGKGTIRSDEETIREGQEF